MRVNNKCIYSDFIERTALLSKMFAWHILIDSVLNGFLLLTIDKLSFMFKVSLLSFLINSFLQFVS